MSHPDNQKISTTNEEWFTVREAMRKLNYILEQIARGKIDKAVLTKQGKMVALIVPLNYKEKL